MIVVLVFCSPLIGSAYAGQIQAKEFSQTETNDISIMETDSVMLIESIEGGGEGGWITVFAAIGVLVCLAVTAA